jgi:predicted metal-dependent hydrolase
MTKSFVRPAFSELTLAGKPILLARKPIKNMYLKVRPPDGHVEITAPMRMPLATIEEFVAARGVWIERTQQSVVNKYSRQRQSLGGPVSNFSKESQKAAKTILGEQLEVLLPRCAQIVGKSPTAVSLRYMKTRWGSCTPASGRIRLNLQLAYMPEKFLEYVLIHELTHLRVGGHGVRFQRYMDEYLPNWRLLRKEMNKFVIV